MFNYIWPIALVVLSNVVYQICAKSVPGDANPLATLTATYLVGAVLSAAFFYILNPGANLIKEYAHFNWAPFALGLVVVGLEVGTIYAYRAGWPVSTEYIVHSACAAVFLIFVGLLVFNESITWNKLVGIAFCLVGLVFINFR